MSDDRWSPNHPSSGKAGITSALTIQLHWPGLPIRDISRHAVMRALFPILTISLLVFGCRMQSRAPFIVADVTPIVSAGRTTEDFGIELDGVFTPLVESGTVVPFLLYTIFSTATNGQSEILVTPRGTNHAMGRFQVIGIPPAPRGIPQVQVTFRITDRQILMSARDLTHKTDLEVERVGGDTKL